MHHLKGINDSKKQCLLIYFYGVNLRYPNQFGIWEVMGGCKKIWEGVGK